jgi:pimeloyl-ACP methyl ester carboxylesterase
VPTPAGAIFIVGGINDTGFVTGRWRRKLAAEFPAYDVTIFRWQQGVLAMLTFADLWRTTRHRKGGELLADRIRKAQAETRGGPVHVVAHSAGMAVTAYALSHLSEDESVASVCVVAAGVSPWFDLTGTVARCKYGFQEVSSLMDLWFLGFGTLLLGTADRVWSPAAGMVGFRATKDPKRFAVRWRPRDILRGWVGLHTAVIGKRFVREVIADWIRQADGASPAG